MTGQVVSKRFSRGLPARNGRARSAPNRNTRLRRTTELPQPNSQMLVPHETIIDAPRRPVMTRTMLFSLLEPTEIALSPKPILGTLTARILGILEAQQALGTVQTEPRFNALRLRQIMVWGPSDGTGDVTLDLVGSTNSVTLQDEGTFRAFGIPGSRRAALNVRPNVLSRQQWLDANATTEGNAVAFKVTSTSGTSGALATTVVRVTMDLR